VLQRLQQWQQVGVDWVIVTTKEGRFVRSLLQQQGIELHENQLFGKEVKRPKHQTLREFLEPTPNRPIHFVEDRLNTLYSVAEQPDLPTVTLYLADWGYNTEPMRAEARRDSRLTLIDLETFCQDFPPSP
jgi:phosphoglycolate phosphatase-like HAD superfamily hydrolase